MKRQIIKIDEAKCNGCGLCVTACHEGAIGMVNGKAKLLRDDYCDGLGNCLPVCPTGAITFEEREAAAYNEEEVKKNIQKKEEIKMEHEEKLACGCPGSASRSIKAREEKPEVKVEAGSAPSELRQWPVQLKLVPVNAPYFENAHLLIAADCAAYAYASFHKDFIKNKVTVIGCPKLDNTDYSEKLAAIIKSNDIQSVTIVRMEVPCCGGLAEMAKQALAQSGKMIPWNIKIISIDGTIKGS